MRFQYLVLVLLVLFAVLTAGCVSSPAVDPDAKYQPAGNGWFSNYSQVDNSSYRGSEYVYESNVKYEYNFTLRQ